MQKNTGFQFHIHKEDVLFSAANQEKEVMNCTFSDSVLDFWLLYDYVEGATLHLTGQAKIGDDIRILVFPYRIELYINDALTDEEWPCGNHFLGKANVEDHGCGLNIYEAKEEKKVLPNVIGTFCNAEGWKPEENVFVGDCMPYVHDGRYHVLYLKDRHHHESKWYLGAHQWAHISTKDFNVWEIHPMAVEIDDPAEASICTGSWILNGDIHYLFYTVRTCDKSPAKICRSVSEDGYHFEKDRSFSFTLSDKYTASSARDPKVVKDENGMFHMFLTSSLKETLEGCLVHLLSEDLQQWKEADEPLLVAPQGMGEPECPDYFYKDGFYYLVYSLKTTGYYRYSKKPFSDWQVPENPVIPCKSVPKAAVFHDRLIFAGFNRFSDGRYGGTMTFLEAAVLENGEMVYKNLE